MRGEKKQQQWTNTTVDMPAGFVRGLLLLLAAAHGDGCRHVDHVVQCFRPILQTTERSVEKNELMLLAGDVQKVSELCKHYFNGQGCLEENLRRCQALDYISRENLKIYVESVVKRGVVRLCDTPSLIHKYAAYGDCFRATQNTTGACLLESRRQFRSGSPILHTESLDELSRRHCRTIEDLMACGFKSVTRTCGHEPGVLYLEIMQRLLSRRAVDACMGPQVRFQHAINGYEHLPSYKISSGAGFASNSYHLFLGMLVVLMINDVGVDF
ncbi:uncharacterized protein LOC124122197 isoform X1 [Haliotis rufescens]|uniref:uncharacterized protein LOC124122197 isoform X1 n=1 Tax=Haliotis rufescens TaxID=6454 RepID=UPI00201F7D68|nr:uncharacterized protein LOC124122197 isoform X1 [Haliotis rufescens]